jgi:hypothetical protein
MSRRLLVTSRRFRRRLRRTLLRRLGTRRCRVPGGGVWGPSSRFARLAGCVPACCRRRVPASICCRGLSCGVAPWFGQVGSGPPIACSPLLRVWLCVGGFDTRSLHSGSRGGVFVFSVLGFRSGHPGHSMRCGFRGADSLGPSELVGCGFSWPIGTENPDSGARQRGGAAGCWHIYIYSTTT